MSDPGRPALRLIDGEAAAAAEPSDARLTVADVAKACGLPQPVIAQLVPRTWTAAGWMYTDAQRQAAIEIAEDLRSARAEEEGSAAPGGAASSGSPLGVVGTVGRRRGIRRR